VIQEILCYNVCHNLILKIYNDTGTNSLLYILIVTCIYTFNRIKKFFQLWR